MIQGLNPRQLIGASLIRAGELVLPPNYRSRGIGHQLSFNNPFVAHQYRGGRLIKRVRGHNGVTVVGKNKFLDTFFGAATPLTQVATWYIGLINNSPTPVLVEGDTLASHSGWTEWTAYSGNRQAWDDADSSNKIKGSTTASSFTISSAGTLYGIMVASVASGTTGILWATGAFDATLDVISSDVIKVTYGVKL